MTVLAAKRTHRKAAPVAIRERCEVCGRVVTDAEGLGLLIFGKHGRLLVCASDLGRAMLMFG